LRDQIVDWVADQKLADEPSKPLPWEYANVLIAERFGKWPEECEAREADRALFYNAVLGAEAEAHRMVKDLKQGDVLVRGDDD
jgi:hypothetical protein